MADEIDMAQDHELLDRDRCIKQARNKASAIPKGEPGECDMCGEWSGRLVDGVCAPCRDRYKLK